jgi:hypothetical protein
LLTGYSDEFAQDEYECTKEMPASVQLVPRPIKDHRRKSHFMELCLGARGWVKN